MPSPRSKPLKYLLITLVALLLVFGLLIGAFQLVVARVPEYRVQLQNWVSDRAGLAIEFRRLSARLRLYGPELVFNDAVVRTPDRTRVLATARRGSVGFDLWASIGAGRLTAGRFTLDSPEIGLIRTRAGRIQLVGQSALPERDVRPIAIENLPIGHFRVSNAMVSFRDEATGRGPWSLSGVSFNLDRQSDSLQLRGDADLPETLGRSLEFSARVQGALENAGSLASDFTIDGKQLDLAGWADLLPDEWSAPETGHGSIRVVSAFKGRQLAELSAKIDLNDVTADAPAWVIALPRAAPLHVKSSEADEQESQKESKPGEVTGSDDPQAEAVTTAPEPPQLVSYDRIALDLHAKRNVKEPNVGSWGDGWEMSVSQVELARKSASWRAARIEASWSRNDAGGLQLAGKADRVVLQNLWPLLAYLPESEQLAGIRALQASGTVENLALNFQRASAQEPPKYSLQADITAAGFQPVLQAPGFTGLTAHVQGTDAGGEIQLDAQDAQLDLPRMFRSPLRAQSIRGVIAWTYDSGSDPAGWRVSSKEIRVESADGHGQAGFELQIPADGSSPVLDLSARGQDLNVAATARYVPANNLTSKTLEWFDRAFVGGRVTHGLVTYKGPTRAFPFRHGEGEFIARARVEDMTFDYQAGWSPATRFAADVEFRNQGMKVTAGTAGVGELNVADIQGDIADFKAGVIAVKAHAAGDLGSALQLLQTSPISGAFGEQFQKLRGKGETRSTVELVLPLKHLVDRRIAVITQLKNTTVSVQGWDTRVTALSGSLSVRQALPDSASMRGQWLGGPLDIAVRSESKSSSLLTMRGHADAAALAALLHLPAAAKVSGATDWRLTTRLEANQDPDPNARQARKFTIQSDLQGLGVALPHPLGKPENASRLLRVELEYDGAREWLGRAALGDVRALLRMRQSAAGWTFDRGAVRADGIAAALPGHRGLRIEGYLDRLILDDWFALKGPSSGASRLSDVLNAANLTVGTLQLSGYQWPEVRGVLQATASGWRVDVAGSNAVGELFIPVDFTAPQPLTANLQRLVITYQGRQRGASTGRDPRSWPSIRASVADLLIEDHAIGAVELQATRVAAGIQIDSITVTQDAVRGEARGQWLITPDGERSTLHATVTSTDVAATLRALNYTPFIEAKRGEISADLAWPGGFDDDFPGRASGTLKVAAENGQLLNLQPGAGRVLGLLSVAALPRRLSLDFSDLTDKGLSFDSVHGDFELRDGNAYTSNLLLRGPAAEIGIAGRTGIGAHDYDQTAVVTGNVGATLPVAGALAGGPAVGAALLLFTQVFKEPLKGIARGYYRITGSWEDPIVERVDAAQIKEAKTVDR